MKREFDGLGQLTSDWQSHAGAVTGLTPRVQYAYSNTPGGANHSRPASMTYPSGRVLTYNYAAGLNDGISRLSSLSDPSGTLEGYDYLGLGTVVRRAHPLPGVDLTYVKQAGEPDGPGGDQYAGLDRFDRVANQRWRRADGAEVERLAYGYDRAGNVTSRRSLVNGAFSEAYAYDGLDQVTSFARGQLFFTDTGEPYIPAPTAAQTWDYDAAGNLDAVTFPGGAQARTHNRQDEVTAVNAAVPAYDANGNLTRDDAGRQYVYDAWDRVVAVKDAGGAVLAAYAYDGLSRRVTETRAGVTTDLYYSAAWQVLEERVGGVAKAQYVWSPVYVDALVVRDRDADGNGTLEERLWAVQDANGNVTALVNSAGVVVERYTTTPFGGVTVYDGNWAVRPGGSVYGWVYTFQGLRYDAATGLFHARFRDYHPGLGRFLQRDPIGFAGGDPNLYRFVGNNPTTWTDPSGLVLPFVVVIAGYGLTALDVAIIGGTAATATGIGLGIAAENGLLPVPHFYTDTDFDRSPRLTSLPTPRTGPVLRELPTPRTPHPLLRELRGPRRSAMDILRDKSPPGPRLNDLLDGYIERLRNPCDRPLLQRTNIDRTNPQEILDEMGPGHFGTHGDPANWTHVGTKTVPATGRGFGRGDKKVYEVYTDENGQRVGWHYWIRADGSREGGKLVYPETTQFP